MNPLYHAARWVQCGGVIAYPTEGVYGLGCDPRNLVAVQRILHIKRRHWDKGLILIAADLAQVTPFLLPITVNVQEKILNAWHDGEVVTWLLPAKASVSPLLRGQFNSLAIRLSQHMQVTALCRLAGTALVSTSANVARNAPLTTAYAVRRYFGSQLDYVLVGKVGELAQPSPIRDALTEQIVRK